MTEVIVHKENPTYMAARIIWTILWIIEAILALRFVLRLIAANPAAGFTDFIYRASRPLLEPFLNVVRNSGSGNTGGVFEWSTLIGMIAYWLLAWAIIRLFLSANTGTVDYVEQV